MKIILKLINLYDCILDKLLCTGEPKWKSY